MKKTAVLTLTVCMLNIVAVAPSTANAAFLEEKLAEILAVDPKATRIQELLSLKDNWEQGNKKVLLETVIKTALERTGNGNIPTANAGGIQENVAAAVRQEVEAKLTQQAVPYYKELALLATLLQMNGQLEPKAAGDNNALSGAPANYRKMLQMTSTAYAPGVADNGKWGNRTYMGTYVRKGIAAVDPSVIPLGTKLWVEGYGEAIAEDTGGAIKGNRIDLAFNNRQEALNYGIQKVNVYVME